MVGEEPGLVVEERLDFGEGHRGRLDQRRVARAPRSNGGLEAIVVARKRINLTPDAGSFGSLREELPLDSELVQTAAELAILLEELGLDADAYPGRGLLKTLAERSRPDSFRRLERERLKALARVRAVELDQEVDVERIALVDRREKGPAEAVARDAGAERLRDSDGVFDRGSCLVELSRVSVGERDMIEGLRFEERVVRVPAALGRLAIACERLFGISEAAMEVPDFVEDERAAPDVADRVLEVYRFLERFERRVRISRCRAEPSDHGENVCFEHRVSELAKDREGVFEMPQRLFRPMQLEVRAAHLEKRRRFVSADGVRAVQLESPQVVLERDLELTHVEVELAEGVRERGFGRGIVRGREEHRGLPRSTRAPSGSRQARSEAGRGPASLPTRLGRPPSLSRGSSRARAPLRPERVLAASPRRTLRRARPWPYVCRPEPGSRPRTSSRKTAARLACGPNEY